MQENKKKKKNIKEVGWYLWPLICKSLAISSKKLDSFGGIYADLDPKILSRSKGIMYYHLTCSAVLCSQMSNYNVLICINERNLNRCDTIMSNYRSTVLAPLFICTFHHVNILLQG
jgi:hypothetical protein